MLSVFGGCFAVAAAAAAAADFFFDPPDAAAAIAALVGRTGCPKGPSLV